VGELPTTVNNKKSAQYVWFPGTRVSVIILASIHKDTTNSFIPRQNTCTIQVVDRKTTREIANNALNNMTEALELGYKMHWEVKRFLIGKDSAVISAGSNLRRHVEQVAIFMATNNSLTILGGECMLGDTLTKNKLLRAFLTTTIDTSVILDESTANNFWLDFLQNGK
jgi:hypothetical protein